jgi:hypothetical protein
MRPSARRATAAWLFAAAIAVPACGNPVAATGDAAPGDAPPPDGDLDLGVPGRAGVDRPDDDDSPQVHVLYVIAADGEDRKLDVNGAIARSVAAWNGWLSGQTGGSRLRLDTAAGVLDVTFARLPSTTAALAAEGPYIRDRIERELSARRLIKPNKLAAVYYDSYTPFSCGGGSWPPALIGKVAALYLRGAPIGAPTCDSNPLSPDGVATGYLELAMLHEVVHALGGAPACAPSQTLSGHVSDSPSDLMYAGSAPWRPSALDVGDDDYWGHGRADCLDLARSALLSPTPASPVVPPGW